jgi:nucleotide-binding universal stress UspA family protein
VESNTEIYEKMVKQMTEHAREYLHKVGDSLKGSGLEVALRVTTGHPADCIVASADELNADAIVMSTHGRSGISRWVYGSVTQKVLSVAHLPVMVIPPKREAR